MIYSSHLEEQKQKMSNRPISVRTAKCISAMVHNELERNHPHKPNGIEHFSFTNLPKTHKNFDSTKKRDVKNKDVSTWSENLKSYLTQYCDRSTIHGIQYVGERGRLIAEKVFWAAVVLVVNCLSLYYIVQAYHKWKTQPVIVSFATKETSIWEIPFPAVTICPEVKADPEVFNYTEVLIKKIIGMELTQNEHRFFETFSLVCSDDEVFDELGFINMSRTVTGNIIEDLTVTFPGPGPPDFVSIRWLGKKYNMSDLISVSLTKEGLCYSFNMFHYDDILKKAKTDLANRSSNNTKIRNWSLDSGYPNDDEYDSFPRRTFLSGISGGFTFEGLFANDSHLDYACSDFLQGFKVALHHPSEIPNMDKHIRVPLDQSVLVAVKPRMTTASEELKSYRPEVRECYFSDERTLKYFKSYSQQNCLDECLSNYTLTKCKCIPFYLPSDDDTPECGPGSNRCIAISKVEYISSHSTCHCMPFCTSLNYDVEITQSDWNWNEFFKLLRRLGADSADFPFDDKTAHFSKLVVFYKDQQFLASERHELYGYVDFFSHVGGLLGLFIGFPVISFIEVLYFLSLRVWCNIKMHGQAYWSGDPALIDSAS